MSCEENKAFVRRFVEEFWNQGNTTAADELMTADATIVLPGRGQVSKEGFKAFAVTLRSAFPDWHSTVEEMIAEGNQVAERWTGRGTHQGEFQGISPTGRQVAVPGFVFYRVISGKISEFHGLFDGLGMLHQLGAMPSSEQVRT
ncbi:MAG: ester cyclase [Ktedonobacteraceae bacterium]|nr:ester cyclase [Ktedonobacteraceae bacterium]